LLDYFQIALDPQGAAVVAFARRPQRLRRQRVRDAANERHQRVRSANAPDK